jgi:C4-dicarboxylate-specific signal transduction histidine kinase
LSSNPKDLGTNVKDRDYFTQAARGRAFVSGVSISTITNKPSIFHSAPVKDASGRIVGVLRSRANLDAASNAVQAAAGRVGAGASGVLLDEQGLVIASADPDWTLHPVVALSQEAQDALLKGKRWGNGSAPAALGQADLAGALHVSGPTIFDWTNGGVQQHAVAVPLGQTQWTYVVGLPLATYTAAVTDFLCTAVLGAVAGVLAISVLALVIARTIARSVAAVGARLAASPPKTCPHWCAPPKPWRLATSPRTWQAVEEILLAVEETVRQVTDIAAASQVMASGARSVTGAMQSISAVVEENAAATEEMAAQAAEVTGATQNIAAVSEEQSAATDEVSASAEEMTSQIEEMRAQAQELAATAEQLTGLVARFKPEESARTPETCVVPLRRAA